MDTVTVLETLERSHKAGCWGTLSKARQEPECNIKQTTKEIR